MDRIFTYEALRKKLSARVPLLRELAELECGATAETLRKADLSFVYSNADTVVALTLASSNNVLNNALRIVTRYLRSTPTEQLSVLAGIQPSEIRRQSDALHSQSRLPGPRPYFAWSITRVTREEINI